MNPKVAVIGGGVSGTCATRACLSQGLDVTLFDSLSQTGGIWDHTAPTPVFDSLTTNTACFETAFSDIAPLRVDPSPSLTKHDDLCLAHNELHDYLKTAVAKTPEFQDAAMFNVEVLSVKESADSCEVQYVPTHETKGSEEASPKKDFFDYVIIASGIHHTPFVPTEADIPGLDIFGGMIMHASDYRRPDQVAGKRVLVVGGSISGCEVVGDIISSDTAGTEVTLSTRKMRYLAAKQKGRRLLLSEMNTRFLELHRLAGHIWNEDFTRDIQDIVTSTTLNEDVSAPAPFGKVHNPHEANWVPVNFKLLEASRTGKMAWNVGGVKQMHSDGIVEFNDGTKGMFDVVIFATGYKLNLPFLDDETKGLVHARDAPNHYLDLFEYSMHPDRKRLAFTGMLMPGTATLPMYDCQARWVAKLIANPGLRPSDDEMRTGIDMYRKQRKSEKAHIVVFGFEVLDRFAKLGGFEVDLSVHKEWTKALIFGPLVPAQFRLFGDGARDEALQELERQMNAAGFEKGDNVVDSRILGRLKVLSDILAEAGNSPKGLSAAVQFLLDVNHQHV